VFRLERKERALSAYITTEEVKDLIDDLVRELDFP
jgi:hypothetical protein